MKRVLIRRFFSTLLFLLSALLSFSSGGFMSDNDSKITQAVGLITAVIGLIKLIVGLFNNAKTADEGKTPKDL
jgi:hypothetical protein